MERCELLPEERFVVYGRESSDSDYRPRKRQALLPKELSMSSADCKAADQLLAEAIYSSGVPFAFVRSSEFPI